jgi:hypothetical protein
MPFESAARELFGSPFTCPAPVAVGNAVYLSAANAVDLADGTNGSKMPAIGIVVSKPTTTSCIVQHAGECDSVSGLTPGSTYYAGVGGALVSSTVGLTVVQAIGKARDTGLLVMYPTTESTGGSGGGGWSATFTTPVDSQFSWVNQGGATTTQTASGITCFAPTQGLADNWRLRVKAAPATPYTITAYFLSNQLPSQADALIWRDSGTGKIILNLGQGGDTGGNVRKYTNPTTYASDYVFGNSVSRPGWYRISDDGTLRKVFMSGDGLNWWLLHSVARTDFLTPDQVGFAFQAYGSYDYYTNLVSWAQT